MEIGEINKEIQVVKVRPVYQTHNNPQEDSNQNYNPNKRDDTPKRDHPSDTGLIINYLV